MSGLDDKLLEILKQFDFKKPRLNSKEAITQIKQAFIADGYVPYRPYESIPTSQRPPDWWSKTPTIMTGREWYARFEKELDEEFHEFSKPTELGGAYYDAENVIKAAKKASGIDE